MNILYIPQLSMYDKQTKRLTPESDGNINMMHNFINEWNNHIPHDYFYILLPRELENSYIDKIKANRTRLYYDNYVVSSRVNRFNFPMKEIKSIVEPYKIDLIISDVIELAGNIKQMFKIEFGYEPKVISNIRHLDDDINFSYIYRVIDGIEQSDLVTILSKPMKERLNEQLEDLLPYYTVEEYIKKIEAFEPSTSHSNLKEFMEDNKPEDSDKIIITFPGRLSKGEEKRTNWDKFFQALRLLKDKSNIIVYFTDPNNCLDEVYPIWDCVDWIKTIPKDRNEFLHLLNKTDIIVSLMDKEGFGGISPREALLFNCRPVIPWAHEYKRMQDARYPGFVTSPINASELAKALDWAIGNGKKPKSPIYSKYGEYFSVERQLEKLMPRIEEILNG